MALTIGTNAQAQFDAQPNKVPPINGGFTLHSISNIVSKNSSNEYVQRLREEVDKKLKTIIHPDLVFSTLYIDKETVPLNYSVLCIVEEHKAVGEFAAHLLIIERTGKYPEQISENYNTGERVKIDRTPGDAFDLDLMAIVSAKLKENYRQPVKLVFSTLIPNEFEPDENAVDGLVYNSVTAVNTEIVVSTGKFEDLNMAKEVVSGKGPFIAEIVFNSNNVIQYDASGMPIRQDIVITLKRDLQTENRYSVNSANRSKEFVKVFGYIDFSWLGPNPNNKNKFASNFVITHMESSHAMTPATVVLGVATVMAVKDDMNWLQGFRPTTSVKGEFDLKDIGGLNVDGNIEGSPNGIGKKVNTKAKDFSLEKLAEFAKMVIYPGLSVSMDIPKAAGSTWFTEVFTAAGKGRNQGAYNRIINGADNLTGGAFKQMFPQNAPIFAPYENVVQIGHWIDQNKVRHDIREFDYLAIANLVADTNTNPSVLRDFGNAYISQNNSIADRLAIRRNIITTLMPVNLDVKMHADRVLLDGMFVQTAVESLRQCGLNITVDAPLSAVDFFQSRAEASYMTAASVANTRFGAVGGYSGNNAYYQHHNPNGFYG